MALRTVVAGLRIDLLLDATTSEGLLKVYYTHTPTYEKFLKIRIAGKYLTDFDFEIGDTIAVKIEMGRITITKVSVLAK